MNRRHRKRVEQLLKEQKLKKRVKTKRLPGDGNGVVVLPQGHQDNLVRRSFHSQGTCILGEPQLFLGAHEAAP